MKLSFFLLLAAELILFTETVLASGGDKQAVRGANDGISLKARHLKGSKAKNKCPRKLSDRVLKGGDGEKAGGKKSSPDCFMYHNDEATCSSTKGCKVCDAGPDVKWCIAKKATCCETTYTADTCPEKVCETETIYPGSAYDPDVHTDVDPDTDCFYCGTVCMTGTCCEPVQDEDLCNSLQNCVWDPTCDGGSPKCIAPGMDCGDPYYD
uniref:Uncharacterized protein n=1 Tax=Grammatophora oceanica TaxID=210454 RepID=A0A7S1V3Y2_9STRA|mmetsp:Transcript_36043/g.53713  ORF Transcript_36043/g.53713 Transcript_36043/m.53713 type:complete len:209 (+) Transcript_36043:151-777(+)